MESNQVLWQDIFSRQSKRNPDTFISDLLKITDQPDMISFAGGLPAPDVFPIEQMQEACQRVLDEKGPMALQYSSVEGYLPLRQFIATDASRFGAKIGPENVMITTGSQQGLDMIGRLFIDEGDSVLVEAPTYMGALTAWNAYAPRYVQVPSDEEGVCVDQIERYLNPKPKFMYILPNFQNPTGVTLNEERRPKLVELARKHRIPIIEDDPYGRLRYDGKELPSIQTLDTLAYPSENGFQSNVIFLGTFSKILAPGLRLGWIIAPVDVIKQLVSVKQGMDLHSSTFNQYLVYEAAQGGFIDRHIKVICDVYSTRKDIMLEELARTMPAGVHWTKPNGGLFLWITLPKGMNTVKLFTEATKEKVAFVPGMAFYTDGSGENAMRLNFSNASPELIREGIGRLARVIEREMKK